MRTEETTAVGFIVTCCRNVSGDKFCWFFPVLVSVCSQMELLEKNLLLKLFFPARAFESKPQAGLPEIESDW